MSSTQNQLILENAQQHLAICSLISKNKNLGKSCKQLRTQLVVNKKKFLQFKINQTKKYNILLKTNHDLNKEFQKIKNQFKDLEHTNNNLTNQNQKFQKVVDNILDVNLEGVKATAVCDGIDLSGDDISVEEAMTIEKEHENFANEMEIPNDIDESLIENTEPTIPSTPPEQIVVNESVTIDDDLDKSTPKKPELAVREKRKRSVSKSQVRVRKSKRNRNKNKL